MTIRSEEELVVDLNEPESLLLPALERNGPEPGGGPELGDGPEPGETEGHGEGLPEVPGEPMVSSMELNLCQKYSYRCKTPHLVYPDIHSPYFRLCPDLRIHSPQSLFEYSLCSPHLNIRYRRACIHDQSSEYSLRSPHLNIRCRSLRS